MAAVLVGCSGATNDLDGSPGPSGAPTASVEQPDGDATVEPTGEASPTPGTTGGGDATPDGSSSDEPATITSSEIPDSWPAAVPTPDGEIYLVIETGDSYDLAVRAPSAEAAQEYVDSLVDAGFAIIGSTEQNDGGFRRLEGRGLEVVVAWTGGDDVLLSVAVRPLG